MNDSQQCLMQVASGMRGVRVCTRLTDTSHALQSADWPTATPGSGGKPAAFSPCGVFGITDLAPSAAPDCLLRLRPPVLPAAWLHRRRRYCNSRPHHHSSYTPWPLDLLSGACGQRVRRPRLHRRMQEKLTRRRRSTGHCPCFPHRVCCILISVIMQADI